MHYVLFLFPFAGVLAARFIVVVGAKKAGIWVIVLLLSSLPQLSKNISAGQRLQQTDLRIEAARWIEQNIADGAVLGVYRIDYSPPLKGDIHRNFLERSIRANAGDPQLVASLLSLKERMPIYTQLTLEYFSDPPIVPPEYRAGVDLRDAKTRETFRRTWMNYEELKRWKVKYVILPSQGYSRFFSNAPPPVGTPTRYYYDRSRSYISQFFAEENPRFRSVAEFTKGQGEDEARISILRVL
jgi:hypothetical protein